MTPTDRDTLLTQLDQGRHGVVRDLRELADRLLERLDRADAHEVLVWMQPHVAGMFRDAERVLRSLGRTS